MKGDHENSLINLMVTLVLVVTIILDNSNTLVRILFVFLFSLKQTNEAKHFLLLFSLFSSRPRYESAKPKTKHIHQKGKVSTTTMNSLRGSSRKDNHPNPAITPAVTPPRKMPKTAAASTNGEKTGTQEQGPVKKNGNHQCVKKFENEYYKQVLKTETIGFGNTMVLFIEKETSHHGGYMGPLLNHSMYGTLKSFGKGTFDVRSKTYLFLRESHEGNDRKKMGYKAKNNREYCRTAIFSWPVEKFVNKNVGTGNKVAALSMIDLKTEKLFRDISFQALAKHCIKFPAEETYAKWDVSHSLTAKTISEKGRLKSLDEVFTDESTAQILFTYYLEDHFPEEDVYKYLKENNFVDSIYRRRSSDGRYSEYVVQNFGFPDDSTSDALVGKAPKMTGAVEEGGVTDDESFLFDEWEKNRKILIGDDE